MVWPSTQLSLTARFGVGDSGRADRAASGLRSARVDDLDAVDQFYQAVRHPALTDIRIDWGDMEAAQVFPARTQDLFVGRPVLVHGRYTGSGRTTATIGLTRQSS